MAARRHHILLGVIALVSAVVVTVVAVVAYDSNQRHGSSPTATSVHAPATLADGIAAMTAVSRKVSADEHMSLLDAARFHAYVATAMARAALVGTSAGSAFQQRLVQFPHLEKAPAKIDPRVAAIVAGATTARGLVSLPASRAAIAEARDDALAALPPTLRPGRFADALGWGYLVATSTLNWARTDGTASGLARPYAGRSGPGR